MKNNELYDEYLGYQVMISSSMEVHRFCTTAIQNAGVERHDFFEIYCALDGNITFTVDGKKIELEKEDIVFASSYDRTSGNNFREGSRQSDPLAESMVSEPHFKQEN